MATIRFGHRTINLPTNRLIRIPIGVLLIFFGILGFLPVLGFWMIPLGLVILSVDIPAVRRWRRKITVRLGAWLKRRYPSFAEKLGFNNGNSGPRNGVNRRS